MNTIEIENTISQDKCLDKLFLGVFASDKLPIITETPSCFIANTDPSNKPGQHWVALFFDKYVEYFDSYGLDPLKPFKIYEPDIINNYCLQNFDSIVCGEYCIYYLHKRSRGLSSEQIINSLSKRNNTDKFVKLYVDKIRVTGISNSCQSCTYRNEGG